MALVFEQQERGDEEGTEHEKEVNAAPAVPRQELEAGARDGACRKERAERRAVVNEHEEKG